MMRQAGAILISSAVVLAGISRKRAMKEEILQLRDFEQALEQLREGICYEKCALHQALCKAASGKHEQIRTHFLMAASSLNDRAGDVMIQGHKLPITSLGASGQAQERILCKLTEEVREDRMRRESRLEERSRSCMSVAVAISAICAIVLL